MTEQPVVAERVAEPGESDSVAGYRPHLDGLRAVAVYLVVLFHAGVGWCSGGFIGVDVFFVLSGYLVTNLLMRDMARHGSIRFGRFYSRRFRRLLPAAFVALIVTAVVYTGVATSGEVSSVVGSFKAAFLYSTNWYFIHQAAGYFGADVSANPVLHFWSLAVEEQFYLLWPLVLGGVYALTRRIGGSRRMRVIRLVIGLGALASVVFALSIRSSNPNRAYYGTDARAYELLAGAFVALTPVLFTAARRFRRWCRVVTPISMGVLVVAATSSIEYNAIVRGVIATIVTCVLIIAVEAVDGGLVKRALSTPGMAYLGKISYGTYLWHWLVILVLTRTFEPSSGATAAVTVLVATGIASLSFVILEQPIRVSTLLDRHRAAVITTGLAISVASALVLIPRIVDPAHAHTAVAESAVAPYLTPIPKDLDWSDPALRFNKCLGQPVSACTVVHGTGPTMLLMGDSHAWMLIPAFSEIARREHMTLAVSGEGGCPWQRNISTSVFGDECRALKDDEYRRVIPKLNPAIIVLMGLDYSRPGPYPRLRAGPDQHIPVKGEMVKATTATIAELRAPGRRILLIEPIPLPRTPRSDFNPLQCLRQAKSEEQCRYTPWLGTSRLERAYRALAARDPDVDDLDLDRLVCPSLPRCDPVVNGQIVKRDPSHLRTKFSVTLAPAIDVFMKSVGIVDIGRR